MELEENKVNEIKKVFNGLKLGDVLKIEIQSEYLYTIFTNDKKYILREYSKDEIKNDYDVQKKKKEYKVSEILKENGVPTLSPINFDGKFLIKYKDTYYLIYDYLPLKKKTVKNISTKNIKKMANTLAILNKKNLKEDLPSKYKIIKIDYNKYLKTFKSTNNELYKALYDNYFILYNLTTISNSKLKYIKNIQCITYSQYNLDNILWDKDYMYLMKFDNYITANPNTNFLESAFYIAKENDKINYDTYKTFIQSYLKKYNDPSLNFKDSLTTAMNYKLQELTKLLENCSSIKKDKNIIDKTISLIKDISLYGKNIETLYKIYQSVTK